jgi:hypothetical protein
LRKSPVIRGFYDLPTRKNTLAEKLAAGIEAGYADRNGRDITSKAIADRAKDSEGDVPISALDLSEVSLVQPAICGEFALRKAPLLSPSSAPVPRVLSLVSLGTVTSACRRVRQQGAGPVLGFQTTSYFEAPKPLLLARGSRS